MREHIVVRDMTISEADFLRLLPDALGIAEIPSAGSEVTVTGQDRRLTVRWTPIGERKLGRLSLPVTRVELRFRGYPDREAARALERFDLYYRSGGG